MAAQQRSGPVLHVLHTLDSQRIIDADLGFVPQTEANIKTEFQHVQQTPGCCLFVIRWGELCPLALCQIKVTMKAIA